MAYLDDYLSGGIVRVPTPTGGSGVNGIASSPGMSAPVGAGAGIALLVVAALVVLGGR